MELRFFVIILAIFSALASLPACVTLSEREEDPLAVHERLVAESYQKLRAHQTNRAVRVEKSSTVYKEAPYEPEEWERMTRAVGARQALTGTQSFRFHSAKSEAGWESNSSRKIFSNSSAASYEIGLQQAEEARRTR